MCYKLRSFTETPHQTMQEEEDFLNGFSTQSLLNYNTYTQLKVCAEKLLEQREQDDLCLWYRGFPARWPPT